MVRRSWPKCIGAVFLLNLFVMISASALAVSFQVVQHDASQDKIRSASYIMETVFFDSFFDSGLIATNIPTVHSNSEEEDEDVFFKALAETRTGLCEYLIMVVIDYDVGASKNSDAVLLRNIQKVRWLVYDAASEKLLAQGEQAVGTVPDKSNNASGVRNFAKKLAGDINVAVMKR